VRRYDFAMGSEIGKTSLDPELGRAAAGKRKASQAVDLAGPSEVAGAGFEPATFGL
jgi:hypothetical protein